VINIKIETQGVADCVGRFDDLKNGVKRRILRRANVASARPARAKAKKTSAFVDRSGLLRQSLVTRTKTYPGGNVASVIGPARDVRGSYRGRSRVPANYAHLVEGGHRVAVAAIGSASARDFVLVRRGKKFLRFGQQQAAVAGMVSPRPFMGPALADTVSVSLDAFARVFRNGVETEAAK
jgi:hypothetical protein